MTPCYSCILKLFIFIIKFRNQSGSSSQTSWGSGTPGGTNPSSQNQYDQPVTSGTGGSNYPWTQGYDATPQPQPQTQMQSTPINATSGTGPGSGTSVGVVAGAGATAQGVSPPAERIPPRPPSAGPPPAGNVDPSEFSFFTTTFPT